MAKPARSSPRTATVIDASALLALFNDEPGAQAVLDALDGHCLISAVNQTEVLTKLLDKGLSEAEAASELVDTLVQAGLEARASDDISSVEWSKFVGWSGFSTLAVMTRQPTWRFLTDADTALIAAHVMRETAAVAIRHGVTLQDSGFASKAFRTGSEEDAVKAVQAHGEKMRANAPGFRQSILQDADRNRRLEVHETLDYTLRLAAELGVATPTLDLCCRVLRTVSRAAG